MYAEAWHTDIYTQNLKTMISQGQNTVQAGFSEVTKSVSRIEKGFEDIQTKMSESKSDRERSVPV